MPPIINMEFFDAHAHYNDEKFNIDRDVLIQKLYQESNITKIISAGYSLTSSQEGIELANKYPQIYTTCGISPNDIEENVDTLSNKMKKIKKMAANSKVVAIGEIGLDYYWNKEYFIAQLELANELNLPVVIHTREAIQDTIDILRQYAPNKKGMMHCCPLNRELVKETLKLGFYISFCGPVTFKNSKNAQEIIELVPNNRMLIETDSPYLSPEPKRGQRNDSSNLQYIAQKIAEVKQMKIEEIAKITYNNASTLFNIP